MTIHYSMDSLTTLFLSDDYISDKNKYLSQVRDQRNSIQRFLNSIEINKNYYRTGIIVKNPKYKKKVSDDTNIIKSFKTSLNKMSSLNYIQLSTDILHKISTKTHLYPLVIQYIFEQALIHHNYSPYYCYLVDILHKHFSNIDLINSQLDILYSKIVDVKELIDSSNYSKLCVKNKQIDQLIGYNIFICELEMKHIISDKISISIDQLLATLQSDISDDELYKCVICLYTLFKRMYKDKSIPETYLQKLTEIKSTIKSMKIKFKLMDIIEHR